MRYALAEWYKSLVVTVAGIEADCLDSCNHRVYKSL